MSDTNESALFVKVSNSVCPVKSLGKAPNLLNALFSHSRDL